MRLLITNLLATALLLIGAASASAFSVEMTSNYNGTDILGISDTVTVSIYIDAEVGVNFFTVGVQAESAIMTSVVNPAPAGQPSYILYSPAAGAAGVTILYPAFEPLTTATVPFPPAGTTQINISYLEANIAPAAASGTNIWIATLIWHVASLGDGSADMLVSVDVGGGTPGTIVRINDANVPSGDIFVTTQGTSGPGFGSFQILTPEPTTALLIGLGLVGLGVAGRRRE
jgi:hypothetical protein